ncbi:MAG: lipoate--protein ligase family protein [Planctomycetes bacterium]|nr:lipoate--protein ligase family protein [Planctomycetota bacterium]
MSTLRVILDGAAPGDWNMAIDEALLLGDVRATLRLYSWSPHAVSLGWFQDPADFADLPAGTPIVRRRTGGGAIHHGEETTFALTCDADVLPREIRASYVLLHDAAVLALGRTGVACRRRDTGPGAATRCADRWCFAVPGRDDVVVGDRKLLGSAQRRLARPRARILHHGSIVLRRPALTPFVAAAADVVDPDADFTTRLGAALVAAIASALELEPVAGQLEPHERALATQVRALGHGDPARRPRDAAGRIKPDARSDEERPPTSRAPRP